MPTYIHAYTQKMQRSRLPDGNKDEHDQRTRGNPLMSPIFSSESPASVAPTSRDAPVCPLTRNACTLQLKKADARSRHENAHPCTDAPRRGGAA